MFGFYIIHGSESGCLVWNRVVLNPAALATVLCFAVQMVDAQKEKNAALTGVVTIACLLVSTESATP